jgi:hypothetical protein
LTLATAFAAIALAYFTKEQHFSLYTSWQMLAALAVFILAFACFLGAILRWPFPPWKKLRFPNIKVRIYGSGFTTTESTIHVHGAASPLVRPATLQVFRVRIVNVEAEQNANLTIRLYAKLVPGSAADLLETVCAPPDWELSSTLNLDPIRMPIVLQPGSATGGDLVYEMMSFYQYARISGRLELEDHVSGKRVSIPAHMGSFDKRTMDPSLGGAEILETGRLPAPTGWAFPWPRSWII